VPPQSTPPYDVWNVVQGPSPHQGAGPTLQHLDLKEVSHMRNATAHPTSLANALEGEALRTFLQGASKRGVHLSG